MNLKFWETRNTTNTTLTGATSESVYTQIGVNSVNENAAQNIAVVYHVVNNLTNYLNIPKQVYKVKSKGDKRWVEAYPTHPINTLLNIRANEFLTGIELQDIYRRTYLIKGESFVYIHRDSTYNPIALYPLKNSDVKVLFDEKTFSLAYTHPTFSKNYRNGEIIFDDMLHFKWNKKIDNYGTRGTSPIIHGKDSLVLNKNLSIAANELYKNGMQKKGFFLSSLPATDQTTKNVNAKIRNSNSKGEIPAIDDFLNFKELSFTAEEAQILLTFKHSNEELCKLWNYPVELFNGNITNLEQTFQLLCQQSLSPFNEMELSEINNKLFNPKQRFKHVVKSDMKALYKSNMTTLTSHAQVMYNISAYNRNEVRNLFDLPPVDGGDVYYFQSNNATPIESNDPKIDYNTDE